MALSSFAGADASTDNQKVALLSNIAQQGSAGAESYKAQAAVLANVRQDAVKQMSAVTQGNGNNAPGAYQAQLGAQMAGPADNYAANNASAAMSFAQDVGRIGAASGSYMDAVKGARPIVESVTSRAVEQTLAELAAKREAMAAEAQARKQAAADRMQQRQWDIEDRNASNASNAEKMGWAREQHGWDQEDRRKKAAGEDEGPKPMDPLWAGGALGLDRNAVSKIMGNPGYQNMRRLTNDLMADPAMTPLRLRKELEFAEFGMRQPGPDGEPPLLAHGYPEARELILNEMSPMFGAGATTYRPKPMPLLRPPPRFNPHTM